MKRILAVFLLLFGTAALADATTFDARVIRVSDGDSITVRVEERENYKVRLGAIDAPERDQPFGNASRKALAALVAGKTVVVDFYKIDRYGRLIAHVTVNGIDAGLAQIENGMAWHFTRFAHEQPANQRSAYADAQEVARESGQGLWSDPNPDPPWVYRDKRRKNKQQTR